MAVKLSVQMEGFFANLVTCEYPNLRSVDQTGEADCCLNPGLHHFAHPIINNKQVNVGIWDYSEVVGT